MKKLLLNRRNALLTPSGIYLGGVLIAIVIFFLLLRLIFPGAALWLARPLFIAGTFLTESVRGVSLSFQNAETLGSERDQLTLQNAILTRQNQALTAKLADIEKFSGTVVVHGAGILAGVLAGPRVAPYDVLIVDAGGSDGISVGEHVYAPGDIPIGVVLSTTNSSSRVTLFSAPGEVTAAWVGNAHLPITLTGQGGGAFKTTVAKGAAVGMGDLVSTTGPGAIPIGTVARVDSDPALPSAVVYITPFVNPESITWVKIAP